MYVMINKFPDVTPYSLVDIRECLNKNIFLHLKSTRAVQIVSDIWPAKIHLHALRSATLIPFEIVSL